MLQMLLNLFRSKPTEKASGCPYKVENQITDSVTQPKPAPEPVVEVRAEPVVETASVSPKPVASAPIAEEKPKPQKKTSATKTAPPKGRGRPKKNDARSKAKK